MSVLHYIDNEVPWGAGAPPAHFGEWDSRTELGTSTITRSANAAFPERGAAGLRLVVWTGNAYMRKDDWCEGVAAGAAIYAGLWIRVQAASTAMMKLLEAALTSGTVLRWYLSATRALQCAALDDGGAQQWASDVSLPADDSWVYLATKLTRATTDVAADGRLDVYVDGILRASKTGIDNFDQMAGSAQRLDLGNLWNASAGTTLDFDEVRVAEAYPEPYAAAPATDLPCAARTCVLYRRPSADSRTFAQYYASELDVPRANLIGLNTAAADESLPDYATFQSQVEAGLDAYFALHPTVAARCTCLLVGYGVPGYFFSAAVKHSAASRLMNYGTAFSSQTDNPLYNPSAVARLTQADLAGKYLACRIDADDLANAKSIIDAAAAVSALAELADADTLHSDDAAYKASVSCQHLRVLTAGLGGYGDDALIWGAGAGGHSFGHNLTVSGTLAPDATGNYTRNGTYDGKPCYERADGAWWIWWTSVYELWFITAVKGQIVAVPQWYSDTLAGDYTPTGGATGTATVARAVGSRAAFADTQHSTAPTLRSSGTACFAALFTGGYAAALGNAYTAADTFDAESFFEMLRIGGTLTEAFAVAIEHLDYTAVPVGSPLMTVAFQRAGYNVYRGVGGIENVDFDMPATYLCSGNTTPTLTGLGHSASKRYTYVVRPVRGASELETPDYSCSIEFETDGAGDWLGDRPARVEFVEAIVQSGGQVELRWGYRTPYGGSTPSDFGIYYANEPSIAPGSPEATETYTQDQVYTKTLTLTGGSTYWFAVTARTAGGVESHLSEIVGPLVADATAPAAPVVYAGVSF